MSTKPFTAQIRALAIAASLVLSGSFALAQDDDSPPPPQPPPAVQRLDDLEAVVQRLTGQVEELQHQNDVLQQKVERLQRELEFQQNNSPSGGDTGTPMGGGDGAGLPASEPPPQRPSHTPDAADNASGLAPGPQNLGTLPRNTPMPLPKPQTPAITEGGAPNARVASLPPASSGDAEADFDSAMALLRRAQYEQAQQAFRAFADAHPRDPHAPDALFWTGDIAYSARHDYAAAARAFVELLKKYAKAGRAPEGMLKLGLSLLALGQKQEGCATLAALPVKYAHAAPALLTRATAERKRAACG